MLSSMKSNNDQIANSIIKICQKNQENAFVQTELNKPVFRIVHGFAKNLTKHSVTQVRSVLFQLLEQLTLQKQESTIQEEQRSKEATHGKQIHQTQNIITNVEGSDEHLCQHEERSHEPVRRIPQPPFLPALEDDYHSRYTLVLDLDETLIHYIEMPQSSGPEAVGESTGHFLIRPGARRFLKNMSACYEVVVFTAAMQDYADWVMDQLDDGEKPFIRYRLYRQHTRRQQHVYLKDLSFLGRDLSRCIIVDNVAANFQNQPENGIEIRSWYDDPNDTALKELTPILQQIVHHKTGDLRIALATYGQDDQPEMTTSKS